MTPEAKRLGVSRSLPDQMPAILDPAGTGDNFTDRYKDEWNYTNFRDKVIFYADKVKQAYENDDREKSIRLWQDVFGTGFKPGALGKAASPEPFSAGLSWSGEQFIDQAPYNYPINIDQAARVHIVGRCTGLHVGQVTRRNGFRQFELAKRGNRVPKNRSLQFTAHLTNIAAPYRLFWKVRNGGDEAARLQALRGEITEGQAGSVMRTESTAYAGTHYVDCYVVKNDDVVAMNRQTVIVV